MPQKRILVVDDDLHLRGVLQLWLEKSGFTVVGAPNGEKALEILRGSEPLAFVLTDFMMPMLNGIELIRVLKENPWLSDTPVVMMSNNTHPEFRQRALDMGAAAFLFKTEGARTIVEKAIRAALPEEVSTPGHRTHSPPSAAQVEAMRESLVAILRLTSKAEGLPPEVRDALASADKIVDGLFAGAPVRSIH